jgi:hypothetical protein
MARPIPRAPIGFRLAHELEGLLTGIRADGIIVQDEVDRLRRWLVEARDYRDLAPFSELAAHLDCALADGRLTIDECDDLLFVIAKLTTVNPHFDAMRSGVQVLMGLLAGVTADRAVPEHEAQDLMAWLEQWSHLRGLWPYDECEAIVGDFLAGGRDHAEHVKYLVALSDQFPIAGAVKPESGEVPPVLVGGVCAVDPRIEFPGRRFVFTGESSKLDRAAMEQLVSDHDGIPWPRVTQGTDYLVVCAEGSPFWAFSCYGRKVEQAYDLRREGHPIVIAHEVDFWDAITQ